MALLARRDYACGELAAKLCERGFERSVVDRLVDDWRTRRLLNDERYAGHFVQYHLARGQGPLRMRRDLEHCAVDDALIATALAAVPDWAEAAREVRRRRFGLRLPDSWKEKSRQARFLQYRGFATDHIRAALGPELALEEN